MKLLLASLCMGLLVLAAAKGQSHDYLGQDCLRYMETDLALFKRATAGEFANKPGSARKTIVKEYLKIYKGPKSSSDSVMRTILLRDREACPKLSGFRKHLIELW